MPIVAVTDLSNQEFLNRYAAPGRVGLAGGNTLIERTIRRMQRSLSEAREKTEDLARTPVPHTAYVLRRSAMARA